MKIINKREGEIKNSYQNSQWTKANEFFPTGSTMKQMLKEIVLQANRKWCHMDTQLKKKKDLKPNKIAVCSKCYANKYETLFSLLLNFFKR